MSARYLAVILAGLLVRPAVAAACGGGDGDGDGGGSSGGGHSGDGGSSGGYVTGNVTTPACYDVSDIHGYQQCRSYGSDWAIPEHLPAIALELSSWSTRVDFGAVDVRGTMSHDSGTSYNYRVVGTDLGADQAAAGAKLRLVGHHGRFYLGLEGGLARVAGDGRVMTDASPDGLTTLTTSADTLALGGVVAGIDHRVGRLSIGGELFAGGAGLVVEATSVRGACETSDTHWAGRGVIEARARADVWMTPWLTVGAYGGKDVVSGVASAGLGIGGHLRASTPGD
ncbi:MAG: hypothetical protein R3B06_07305 [Kofleriaceae bacterium]